MIDIISDLNVSLTLFICTAAAEKHARSRCGNFSYIVAFSARFVMNCLLAAFAITTMDLAHSKLYYYEGLLVDRIEGVLIVRIGRPNLICRLTMESARFGNY